MANIIIFGDSITWGAWDEEGGWVERLKKTEYKKAIENASYVRIYNVGISGDNTDDLLVRFEQELKNRVDEEEETIIIFAIGINDSQYDFSNKAHRVPLEKFKENLASLLASARKYSSKIIFVGLTPTDDSQEKYKLEYVKNYNQALEEFCEENKVHFIHVLQKFLEKDYEGLLVDGLHPNSEGHMLIYGLVNNYLREKGFS